MIGELTPEQVQRLWTKARPHLVRDEAQQAAAMDDHPSFEAAMLRLNADIAAIDAERRDRLITPTLRPADQLDVERAEWDRRNVGDRFE
jgi:hypothetical protein